MTQQTSILDQLVSQKFGEYQSYKAARQAREEQEAAEQKAQQEQEAQQELAALLEQYLSVEFLEHATITYRHKYVKSHYPPTVTHTCVACFPYAGYEWCIERDGDNPKIYIAELGTTQHVKDKGTGFTLTWERLQATLLVEMGKTREQIERQRQQQQQQEAEREGQRRIERDLRVAEEQQKAAERKQELAQAEAEHQHLTLLFTTARTQAEAALWQWPAGATLTIYKMEYCRGQSSEEDSTDYDYVTGWTTTDELDERGYIQVEPQYHHYYSWDSSTTIQRRIKLSLLAHHPVWEAHTYTSIDDLPEELCHEMKVSLPGVRQRPTDDGRSTQLYSDTRYQGDDEYLYQESIGKQPLPWIRTLVDMR